MRYSKRYIGFTAVLAVLLLIKFEFTGQGFAQTVAFRGANLRPEDWNPAIAADVNESRLVVSIDGQEYTNYMDGIYMDDDLEIMMPANIIRDAFDCSAHLYSASQLMIEKQENMLVFELDSGSYIKNKEIEPHAVQIARRNGRYFIPLRVLAGELGYSFSWDIEKNMASVQYQPDGTGSGLPYRYDLREKGRAPKVKDQGPYGTCWAFAALTAMESTLLPENGYLFSVDHMNQNNSFTSPMKDGGQYTMAMAYLAAWQGPVNEADDPYGDGKTDPGLAAVRHVQDMEIIEAKDLEGIKAAVFKYGGVESCIYTTMQGAGGESSYYNGEKHAYCYLGGEKPNHDVVIIGWDDNFPKEDFRAQVSGDGAFICQNSWGSSFGDNGIFYVSYYDSNIGIHNLVYTGIEEPDNYSRLYQSDLCGWVGQMGYERESIYGANVFTAKAEEDVSAAGFYTTGKDTEYKVFIVPEFVDTDSLSDDRILAAEGRFANAGYHTARFEMPIRVQPGKKFAVVLWLSTPNAARPLAIEYAADDLTQDVILDDGEGYISPQGQRWSDAMASECNLCIKAYTRSAR